jgi:hypothetical protein
LIFNFQGVSSIVPIEWLVFAHEVGHNFGGKILLNAQLITIALLIHVRVQIPMSAAVHVRVAFQIVTAEEIT